METTFEIMNSEFKSVSNGLNKTMILHSFVTKKLTSKGFFIRDSHGVDMKFNEFMALYID